MTHTVNATNGGAPVDDSGVPQLGQGNHSPMDVTKHLERAAQEAKRKNYDLAISLYDQLIALDPNNGEARSGKRRAQLKKQERQPTSSLTAAMVNLIPNICIMIGGAVRLHGLVASCAERALGSVPDSVRLNLALGHALLSQGHNRGAEAAFGVVAEFAPNDVESMRTLGELYYESKKYDKALECFERVLKVSPRDQIALKMRKNLAAEGAIKIGGFEAATSARDLAQSQAQMEELEGRQKMVQTEESLEAAASAIRAECENDPNNAEPLIRLGTLFLQQRNPAEAAAAFERALRLQPDDFELQSRLGDARLMAMDTKIREAQQDDTDGIDGADDRLRRLKGERTTLRVNEFKLRVEARPTDASLRFRLGQYLLEANELELAIAELQLAVRDPRRKYEAMALLGQAFLKQGMADLAIRQLKGALEGLGGPGDKTLGLLYLLGQAAESASDKAGALDWYGSIYEIKAGYRDVADRMARLRE